MTTIVQGIIGADGKGIPNVTVTTSFNPDGDDGKAMNAFARKFHQTYHNFSEEQLEHKRAELTRECAKKRFAATGAEETKYFPIAC